MSHLKILKLTDIDSVVTIESHDDFLQAAISCESQYHQITAMFAELDRASDLAVSLEDIATVLEQSESPLTSSETALVQIAGDLAAAGTDVEPETIIPSLESVSDKSSTISNIHTRVKQIIAALLAFIKNVLKKLKNFATMMAELYFNVDKRIDSMIKRAKSYSDKKTEFTHVSSVKSLVGFPSAKSQASDARVITDTRTLLKELNNYYQDIKSVNLGSNIDRIAQMSDSVVKVVNSDDHSAAVSELRKALNIFTIKQEHAFLGGLILTVNSEELDSSEVSPSELASFFRNTRVVAEHSGDSLIKSVDSQELMPVDAIIRGLEVLKEIVKISSSSNGSSIQSQLTHAESVISRIQTNLTKVLEQIEKSKDVDATSFNFARAVIPEFLSFATSASTVGLIAMLKNSVTVTNGMLAVFQKHLSVYQD